MNQGITKERLEVIEKRVDKLIGKMTVEEKTSQLLHISEAIPRLDVPEYDWWNECLHGVARAGRATVFPQAIGLAATFDVELLERIGDAISDEARAKHHAALKKGNRGRCRGLTFWSPNVNIFRDPRWGRGHETYGEDPFLAGALGAAFVRGLQGDDPNYLKITANAKHFAVHSGPEGCRHAFDARVSEKDLRETYLPAFKALVDAGVEAVMGAYNRTNGEVCCGSETLLVDILRGEWGFEGHVTSDCWAVRDFHEHHKVTSGPAESAALALKNGCDLNCGCAYESLLLALKSKLIEENDIDTALRRMLRTRFKLGMFDDEEEVPFSKIPLDVVCCEKHLAIARDAASKSVVLLKNKNKILPLRNKRKILVTGPNALSVNAILGNYFGLSDKLNTILEGIVGAVPEECTVTYNIGCLLDSPKTNVHDWAVFEAKENDVVIAVMGLDGTMEGEEGDAIRTTDGDRMRHSLPKPQLEYLKGLSEIDVPVILVLTGGSPIDVPEELVEAVLFVWYPGQEGGNAVADIIFGKESPSGRLPITFPKSWEQLPPFEDYAMIGRTYKYMTEEPQYPFGFGLSYAKFEYEKLKLENNAISAGDNLNFVFQLTNSSDVDAEEVIQTYVGLQGGYPEQPLWKLVSFERKALKRGETALIKISVPAEKLKSVNNNGAEVFIPGNYTVYVGGSSPGKRSFELGASIVSATFAIS